MAEVAGAQSYGSLYHQLDNSELYQMTQNPRINRISFRVFPGNKPVNMGAPYLYEYFNVTFPQEYVVHVEINREKKLNAFFDR